MNPAPNATKCSMSLSSLVARRVTASAPSTLPSAATSAYTSALDTGEEILLGVLGRVVEHLAEQALQHLPHLRQPVSNHGGVFRVGIAVAPLPDGPAALDIVVGALEPRQEGCGVLRE